VRLPAEVLRRLLVQQQNPASGVRQLGGRDQSGQAGSDDDDVCVHAPDAALASVLMSNRTAVIGAGSSGMVALKALVEAGVPVDCFEKGDRVGGNWVFRNTNGMSASYRSLHINTSRERMEYSDFPMPKHYPDFPHHSHIAEYFESYVDHFDLRRHIRFSTGRRQAAARDDGLGR
jgi:cation diffusion facilitator CzcD-associated flavoprotein CzcO